MAKKFKVKEWITKGRPEETIGGGFIVFRRGDGTKRVRPAYWPFEHSTPEAAYKQAEKLAQDNPGKTFEVFQSVAALTSPAPEIVDDEPKVAELA
jgi:hypothetical protein